MADNNTPLFKAPNLVSPAPKPLSSGELWAGRARAVGQGLFSLGDEAEAAVRAAAGEDYSKALQDIRQKYARYKAEEPIASTGIELGTGLAASLIPVAGWGGRATQFAGRVPALARVVGQGALAGGLSGFGGGEGGFENRAATGAVGAGLGGALGAVVPAAGATGRYLTDVYRTARGKVSPERAMEMAQSVVSKAIQRGGTTIPRLYGQALRDEASGMPAVMAQLNPELMALTETVAQRPSAGRRALVEEIAGQQVSAPEKYKAAIQTAIPSPDYFARQDQVLTGLRARANNLYDKAYEHGDVRDPALLDLLDNPDMQKAFQDATLNSERLAAAAKTRGEDASKYALKPIYDPILDVQGNLVGAKKTGEAPDVRTLDFVKQALDRRISSLYSSGQGGEATALKEMRDAMVERLDKIAPDYKTARAAYAGDIEVANALKTGREEIPNMRWQEVKQLWHGKDALSAGEKEAVKTGWLQNLVEPVEDATGNRNFAQRVVGSEDWRKKAQIMLEPKEYRVLEKALRRQSELFSSRSQVLGGSATARRVASKEDLDAAISGGDVNTVADLITRGRSGLIGAGIAALDYAHRANMSDAAYTQIANILKTKGPAEIAQTLRDLRDAATKRAAQKELRTGKQQKIVRGAAAAVGPAPREGVDTSAPEQPFVLRVPSFEEEPPEQPTVAPSPDLQ